MEYKKDAIYAADLKKLLLVQIIKTLFDKF